MHRCSTRLVAVIAAVAAMPMLSAMDADIRIVPQVLFNNAGFEPGVALELRADTGRELVFRPELLLTDGGDSFGGGLSVLLNFFKTSNLPDRSTILLGPRFIHHNDDDYGWDAGAMAIWTVALGRDFPATHHYLEVIGVVGAVQDRDEDDIDPSLTIGAGYAYRF